VAGAAVGCAVGHHRAKVKAKEQAAQERPATTDNSASANVERRDDEASTDVRTSPRW